MALFLLPLGARIRRWKGDINIFHHIHHHAMACLYCHQLDVSTGHDVGR